jgi:hypothetical protein
VHAVEIIKCKTASVDDNLLINNVSSGTPYSVAIPYDGSYITFISQYSNV